MATEPGKKKDENGKKTAPAPMGRGQLTVLVVAFGGMLCALGAGALLLAAQEPSGRWNLPILVVGGVLMVVAAVLVALAVNAVRTLPDPVGSREPGPAVDPGPARGSGEPRD